MTATPKERPILFNSAMVKAILDGRKTQERRVVKPQPIVDDKGHWFLEKWNYGVTSYDEPFKNDFIKFLSPFGIPGDRLWVRERMYVSDCGDWFALPTWDGMPYRVLSKDGDIFTHDKNSRHRVSSWSQLERYPYMRDHFKMTWCELAAPAADAGGIIDYPDKILREYEGTLRKQIPSSRMPRWASRITLEITNVRVERVQDIVEDDAKAEGINILPLQNASDPSAWWQSAPGIHQTKTPKISYRLLWDSLNEKHGFGWDANPWVWAVDFIKV